MTKVKYADLNEKEKKVADSVLKDVRLKNDLMYNKKFDHNLFRIGLILSKFAVGFLVSWLIFPKVAQYAGKLFAKMPNVVGANKLAEFGSRIADKKFIRPVASFLGKHSYKIKRIIYSHVGASIFAKTNYYLVKKDSVQNFFSKMPDFLSNKYIAPFIALFFIPIPCVDDFRLAPTKLTDKIDRHLKAVNRKIMENKHATPSANLRNYVEQTLVARQHTIGAKFTDVINPATLVLPDKKLKLIAK
ncbi:MAG: hypothetical protein J0G32_06515 [Alphaproteobacteria bacterium]|nr:hypothetical protein [Alphaproteobacteria bacterium]OJV12079.1 MAG: hypothetical protein BGO27_04985 [Alphaproteobacteria bacterium 33-17]